MSSTAKITIDETYGMVSERTRYLYSEKATYQSGLQIGGLTIISASALALDVTGLVNLRSVSITDLVVTDVIATNAIITNISAGSLNLSGDANVANLTVRGSASVTLDEAVVGNFNLTGNMTVSGTTLLQGLLTAAQGAIIRNGSATITDLIVTSAHATTISVVTLNANALTVGRNTQTYFGVTATGVMSFGAGNASSDVFARWFNSWGADDFVFEGQGAGEFGFWSRSIGTNKAFLGVGRVWDEAGGNNEKIQIGSDLVAAGEFDIIVGAIGTGSIRPLIFYTGTPAVEALRMETSAPYMRFPASGYQIGTDTSISRTSANTITVSATNLIFGAATATSLVANNGSVTLTDAIITNAHVTNLSALNANINVLTVGGNTQLQTLTATTVTLGATGVTNLSTSGALIAGATGVSNLSALNAQINTLTVAGASTFAAVGVSSLSTSGTLNTGNITTLSGSTVTLPAGISFAPTSLNLQNVVVSNFDSGANPLAFNNNFWFIKSKDSGGTYRNMFAFANTNSLFLGDTGVLGVDVKVNGTSQLTFNGSTAVYAANILPSGNVSLSALVVAGSVADSNFTVTPVNGAVAVDSSNGRMWLRYGDAWHYINVTAGLRFGPHPNCPNCGKPFEKGDKVEFEVDWVEASDPHSIPIHSDCNNPKGKHVIDGKDRGKRKLLG